MQARPPDEHVLIDIHDGDGRFWWACQYPERPFDEWVCWLWDCDACMVAAVAEARSNPEKFMYSYREAGEATSKDRLPDTLAAARAWRAEHGEFWP